MSASIEKYLLEKSRINFQAEHERYALMYCERCLLSFAF